MNSQNCQNRDGKLIHSPEDLVGVHGDARRTLIIQCLQNVGVAELVRRVEYVDNFRYQGLLLRTCEYDSI